MKDRKINTVDVDALYSQVCEQANHGASEDIAQYRKLLQDIKPYYQKWYNGWMNNLELDPYYKMNSRN